MRDCEDGSPNTGSLQKDVIAVASCCSVTSTVEPGEDPVSPEGRDDEEETKVQADNLKGPVVLARRARSSTRIRRSSGDTNFRHLPDLVVKLLALKHVLRLDVYVAVPSDVDLELVALFGGVLRCFCHCGPALGAAGDAWVLYTTLRESRGDIAKSLAEADK